jgi:pilus assembly protein CpaF
MVLMAGYDLPVKAIRQQVASALDLIIQLERLQDGSRRVVSITEVGRMESEVVTLSELFRFKVDEVQADRTVIGRLVSTGLRPTFLDKFERRGITLPHQLFSNARGVAPEYLRSVEA